MWRIVAGSKISPYGIGLMSLRGDTPRTPRSGQTTAAIRAHTSKVGSALITAPALPRQRQLGVQVQPVKVKAPDGSASQPLRGVSP